MHCADTSVDVNGTISNGSTPLSCAVEHNQVAFAGNLIRMKPAAADPDLVMREGETALSLAAKNEEHDGTEMVRVLLACGASCRAGADTAPPLLPAPTPPPAGAPSILWGKQGQEPERYHNKRGASGGTNASFVHYQSIRSLGPNCCGQLPAAWRNQSDYKNPRAAWESDHCFGTSQRSGLSRRLQLAKT